MTHQRFSPSCPASRMRAGRRRWIGGLLLSGMKESPLPGQRGLFFCQQRENCRRLSPVHRDGKPDVQGFQDFKQGIDPGVAFVRECPVKRLPPYPTDFGNRGYPFGACYVAERLGEAVRVVFGQRPRSGTPLALLRCLRNRLRRTFLVSSPLLVDLIYYNYLIEPPSSSPAICCARYMSLC